MSEKIVTDWQGLKAELKKEFKIKFGVFCSVCGASLDIKKKIIFHGDIDLGVVPCEDCLLDKLKEATNAAPTS